MDYNLKMKIIASYAASICNAGYKKTFGNQANSIKKRVNMEFKQIVLRTPSIGNKNCLFGAYSFGIYFIAMNRATKLSAEENYTILEHGLANSRLYKKLCGTKESYFSEKKRKFRKEWDQRSHERRYANDWVVHYVDKTKDYEFGFDYEECGICKLFHQENCFELAKYLCKIDYLTAELTGITLHRSQTIANGAEYCDFRFVK